MVVLYGGALHNDLPPPRGAGLDEPRWSYAPALDDATGGRFVALDLVVPEFLGDDATSRAFAWWPAYERARASPPALEPNAAAGEAEPGPPRTFLFHTGAESFALVFPESRRPADAGARRAR